MRPTDDARGPARPRLHPDTVRDLRGGARLGFDALQRAVDEVEAVHGRLAEVSPPVRGVRPRSPREGLPAAVYRGLRGATDLVAGGVDLALASVQAWAQDPQRARGAPASHPRRHAAVAALNAALGDHLHRTDNPLAIGTSLQVALPSLPRVLVLAHDIGLDAQDWSAGADGSTQPLADALPATAVALRFNSGRPVAAVAREAAALLEQRVGVWPVPVQRIDLVGHGLGGLVLRSAVHQAMAAGQAWPSLVQSLVTLGTPWGGVRTGRWLDVVRATGGPHTGLAMATATRHRSAGTADFLQGRWLEHAPDEAPPQWPAQARACALAGRLDGAEDDGLVDVASALGRGLSPGQALPGGEPGRCVVDRVGHAALPHDEAVLAQVRRWMAE